MSTKRFPVSLWQIGIALLIGVLLWFLWQGLFVPKETIIVENQQGRSFPHFSLATVQDENKMVTLKDLQGKPHLLHIFASWCGVCIDEHSTWMNIQKKSPAPIVGVVYRDDVAPVKALLEKKGDPYLVVLNDVQGKLGLDLGLVGVPETYVLDAKGNIRMHQLGAISMEQFESELMPLLNTLQQEAT